MQISDKEHLYEIISDSQQKALCFVVSQLLKFSTGNLYSVDSIFTLILPIGFRN